MEWRRVPATEKKNIEDNISLFHSLVGFNVCMSISFVFVPVVWTVGRFIER